MIEVQIETEDIKLADMGIDQPAKFKTLRFKEWYFVGYWVSDEAIVFYVGSQTFTCEVTKHNIDLFESILSAKAMRDGEIIKRNK